MMTSTEEHERPHEWLRQLSENRRVWTDFVANDDVLSCAYRIAVARRRVTDRCSPRPIPTLREVDAALCELEVRGVVRDRAPRSLLGDACQARGFLVISSALRRAA